MSNRVLIIGSKGMAGHVIYHYLKGLSQFEVADISRDDQFFESAYKLDVTEFDVLSRIISTVRPQFVINCIGLLNATAEGNPDQAVLLNSYFPHFLARTCTDIKAKLIHISTDCVFSGKKGSYIESDPKDGVGFYAQSKALGEVTYGEHLTIRTSIVGPELKNNGIGLMQWFFKQSGDIKGYTHAFWSGVTTLELAKAISHCIGQQVSGLYQLTNGTKISKFDLLSLFAKHFPETKVSIHPYDGYFADKSLLSTRTDVAYRVPTYDSMISEIREWMNERSALYQNMER